MKLVTSAASWAQRLELYAQDSPRKLAYLDPGHEYAEHGYPYVPGNCLSIRSATEEAYRQKHRPVVQRGLGIAGNAGCAWTHEFEVSWEATAGGGDNVA